MQFFEKTLPGPNRAKLFLLNPEVFQYLINGGIAHVLDQLQRSEPGKSVGRFYYDTQKRQGIFNMRRFSEAYSAKFAKRDALFSQLNFQIK